MNNLLDPGFSEYLEKEAKKMGRVSHAARVFHACLPQVYCVLDISGEALDFK